MRRLTVVVILAAASAVSGCVTVSQRPPAPDRAAAPGPAAASSATARPVPIVQGPAHEVLASVRPEEPGEAAGGPADHRPGAGPRQRVAHPRRPVPRPAPAPAPAAPRPRGAAPAAGGGAVCDMGEKYGGWAGQSDASRICRQAYGN